MPAPETLGALLRRRRRELRLTQAAAARACGLARMHVWSLERDRSRNPTISVMAALVAVYGVSWGELVAAWQRGNLYTTPAAKERQ